MQVKNVIIIFLFFYDFLHYYFEYLLHFFFFFFIGGNTVTVSKGASPLVLYAWIGYMPAFSFACAFILRGMYPFLLFRLYFCG